MDTVTTTVRPGSIVVGDDGSEHAARAVRSAAAQASLENRTLTVLTAVPALTSYALGVLGGAWLPPQDMTTAIREHAVREGDALVARLAPEFPDLEVEIVVLDGDPRQLLLDASQVAASIFLGSRGRGPIASLLLGSVSLAVVRSSHCPVFVERPRSADGPRAGVLVGTDCTSSTRSTLEFAYSYASFHAMPLTVLFCIGGAISRHGGTPWLDDEAPGYAEQRRELAETVAGMGEKYPDVRVRTLLGHGLADICLVQESEHMDLVVLGHHSPPLYGDLFQLGSFVAPVVENARCSVVVVPGPAGGITAAGR